MQSFKRFLTLTAAAALLHCGILPALPQRPHSLPDSAQIRASYRHFRHFLSPRKRLRHSHSTAANSSSIQTVYPSGKAMPASRFRTVS